MSLIDIAFIIAIIFAAWKGFKKGFVIELFTFLALFLGLYAGIHFSDFISEMLKERFEIDGEFLPAISFTIIFLMVGAMVYFGGKAIEKVVKIIQLSILNKLLGVFLSILKMVFVLGTIVLLIEFYDEKRDFIDTEAKNDSLFYNPLKNVVLFAIPAFEQSTLFLKNSLVEGNVFGEEEEEIH